METLSHFGSHRSNKIHTDTHTDSTFTNKLSAPWKIRIIIPYFGEWPAWMPYYLESLKFNPAVSWLFFTDCGEPIDKPANAEFIDISRNDYYGLISDRLGINFRPANPYKLCDIRPAFGFIHEDFIADFDYWGFGDIDLIYGNLLDFYENFLGSNILISNHARRISGHLCLIRNRYDMNRLFMRIPEWKPLFSSEIHHAIDEGAFSRLFLKRKNFPDFICTAYNWVTNSHFRHACFRENHTTPYCRISWHDGSFAFPDHWIWTQGRITNNVDGNSRDFPYFHFMKWKNTDWQIHFSADIMPSQPAWKITPNGFQPI